MRVLSDSVSAYKSYACAKLGIEHKRTSPLPPLQTNGKIERFHRTLADGWATPASTSQLRNATTLCPASCTSTITTDPTPPSAAGHRLPD